MSLELSKEMLTVEGYIADARLITEKQLGRSITQCLDSYDSYPGFVLEVAKLLQIERQHNLHKKPRPEKAPEKVSVQRSGTDRVMSEARSNPQVPPMVSASDDDDAPVIPKRKHTRKIPVEVKPTPRRVPSLSEGKALRVRKPKIRNPAKPRRR
jgi:hypothetical protein